jgi:3D (Asp-Asp-Asp) domain-containing protein
MKKFYILLLSILPSVVFASCEDGIYNVSAYYSPLPGQESYSTGTYAGDIRLNGSGVNTASGVSTYDVDSLFLAAPSCFKFGSILEVEGIGRLKVLDRGGSIKGNKLDIWLGFGQEALNDALKFGRQDLAVKVLSDDSIVSPVKLVNISTGTTDPFQILEDIKPGSKNPVILMFKQFLFDLDLYSNEIDDIYDESFIASLNSFIKHHPNLTKIDPKIILSLSDQKIILKTFLSSPNEYISLESLLNNDDLILKYKEVLLALGFIKSSEFETSNFSTILVNFAREFNLSEEDALSYLSKIVVDSSFDFFTIPLKLGDSGLQVRILQKLLKELNYLNTDPTGYYGKITENAVSKLQLNTGLVTSNDLSVAGYFGPSTRAFLNNLLLKKSLFLLSLDVNIKTFEFTGIKKFDSSNIIKTLQELLIKNDYLNTPFATDYYGESTYKALSNFADDNGLLLPEDGLISPELDIKLKALLN